MSATQWLSTIRFVPLDSNAPKFFGFAEFLAALALMVLVWMIADPRYQFRIRVAPLPLEKLTFAVVAAVGLLAILTDLWRAQGWPVPQGHSLTPAEWQAILGGAIFLTFLGWVWFAFIRPSVYGAANAERYARALYRVILKGSPSELPVIADEFAHSARALVRNATDREDAMLRRDSVDVDGAPQREPRKVVGYADAIMLLIADIRFCRTIVDSSPGTALAVFREIATTKKYGVQVKAFANNLVTAALANRDSFLFHETEGYESGLLGYHKPLSASMFSNYQMVEAIGTLLDPDLSEMKRWEADQWKAYCRIVLMTFRDYVTCSLWNHSFVLYRAKGYIERAAGDLYKLNGSSTSAWDSEVCARLRVVVSFIKDAVEILDKEGVPPGFRLRVRRSERSEGTFYDHLADMIVEVIFDASQVRSPERLCWFI